MTGFCWAEEMRLVYVVGRALDIHSDDGERFARI